MIDKMLFDLEKFNKKDIKIKLVSLTFFIESCKKIKEKSLDNLTDTAKDSWPDRERFDKYYDHLNFNLPGFAICRCTGDIY